MDRHRGVNCNQVRPTSTNTDVRMPSSKSYPRAWQGWDGRVDLYAGFCAALARGGGHPSRPAVAGRLQRPTRRHRAGSPQASAQVPVGTLLALLRVGFTEPPRSPGALVGSYPTVSPLPP